MKKSNLITLFTAITLLVFISGFAFAQDTSTDDWITDSNGTHITTGNVGIGTDTPSVKEEIKSSAGYPPTSGTTSTAIVRISGTGISPLLDIGLADSSPWGAWLQATRSTDLSNNYPLMLNPNGGNVGIGTTTPSKRIHVKDNSSVQVGLIESSSSSSLLSFQDSGTDADNTVRIGSSGNDFIISTNTAGAGATRITVKENGNVGIGTTNPLAKLDVRNGAVLAGTVSAIVGTLQFAGYYSGDNILNTYGSEKGSGNTVIGYAVKPKVGTANAFVSSAGNAAVTKGALVIGNTLEFYNAPGSIVAIDNDVPMTNRFFINSSGDVGIGTTDPGSYKLNVVGSVRANEIVVNTTGADYVFEEGYELRPLDEVAQYVEKEKHLPEIPSASEMEINGVGVSEMQIKLLSKVEELTLYVIKQNKKLESQNDEIVALKKELEKMKKNMN